MNTPTIRAATAADIPAIATIAEAGELFPADMLPDMIAPFLGGHSEDHWLVAEHDGQTLAFVFCEPERMTEGTANMLALATLPEYRSTGIGTTIVAALETVLRKAGYRLLIVETSSLAQFERTRAFYRREGYEHEATLREFYSAGEDKVVFRKLL